MQRKPVVYPPELVAKAVTEKLVLVTLDVSGQYAGVRSQTFQDYLTADELVKVRQFFEWLKSRGESQ